MRSLRGKQACRKRVHFFQGKILFGALCGAFFFATFFGGFAMPASHADRNRIALSRCKALAAAAAAALARSPASASPPHRSPAAFLSALPPPLWEAKPEQLVEARAAIDAARRALAGCVSHPRACFPGAIDPARIRLPQRQRSLDF